MPIGTVKWFDNRKGWGFVVQPDGSDLFVHYSSIVGDGFRRLEDGSKVEYDLEDGPKGPQAGNVRLLDEPAAEGDAAPGDEADAVDADAASDDETSSEAPVEGDLDVGNGAEAEPASEAEPTSNS